MSSTSAASVFRLSRVEGAQCHRFRHTLASELLVKVGKGGSIDVVAEILVDNPLFGGIRQSGGLEWWPGTESNRRRQPFQGCALPAELPGQLGKLPCRNSNHIRRLTSRLRQGSGVRRVAAALILPPWLSRFPHAGCSHAHPSSQLRENYPPADATLPPVRRNRAGSHQAHPAPCAHNTAPHPRSHSDRPLHTPSARPRSSRPCRPCRLPPARHNA